MIHRVDVLVVVGIVTEVFFCAEMHLLCSFHATVYKMEIMSESTAPSPMSTLQREDIPSSYSASDNVKYFHAVSRFDHVKNFEARSVFHQGDYKRGRVRCVSERRPSDLDHVLWVFVSFDLGMMGRRAACCA